tara:strand:+ start:1667 stop:1930 length:264 start_codon:yes stop_codon:yes gene_type:complete
MNFFKSFSRFLLIVFSFLILFLSIDFSVYAIEANNSTSLPSSLLDDDSFSDLPFEQLRQALREEVERSPMNENRHRYLSMRPNILIR